MSGTAKSAEDLRNEITTECEDSLRYGRWTHRAYLLLAFGTVASSALSAILTLQFVDEIPHWIIGAIALIPGICAGVSDRFHLLLKKHWYYRRYDRVNALGRRMDYILPREPSDAQIADVARDLCKIESEMCLAWEQLEAAQPTDTTDPRDTAAGSKGRPRPKS